MSWSPVDILHGHLDERISEGVSETKDEIDYALLEWLSSWIDVVQTTDLNDELESTLSHFLGLVHAPLARELCQLFVITSQDLLVGLFVQFFARLNIHAFLDEQTQSADDGFLTKLTVYKDRGNDVAGAIVRHLLRSSHEIADSTSWVRAT